ncbi:MAG: class I SAM-dependent methyltransferase [Arenibacterium sp.]
MAHVPHLTSVYPLAGRAVVDIGAGDGLYAEQLHAEGATVTAVEIDPDKVARARARLASGIDVLLGAAEDLPIGAGTQDLACLFFSLHHVPADRHARAFDEICRVVKPGGRLHIVEPYPYGTMFDVVRLVDDETHVRTHSHKLLNRLETDPRFRLLNKHDYVLTRNFPGFDALVDRIIRTDPARAAMYENVATEMQMVYNRVVETAGDRNLLHQPCAAYHFEVTAGS